jgi:hypothetical protein
MMASRLFLHEWNPFWPQIRITLYSIQHPEWLRDMWGTSPYLAASKRLFLPAFVLPFGAVFIWAARKTSVAVLPLYVGALVCCSIYAFQQFLLNSVVLRVHYHSSYMVVVVLGFSGAVIGEFLSRAPGNRAVISGLLVAAVLCCPIVMNRKIVDDSQGESWIYLAVLGAVTTLLACTIRWRAGNLCHLACLLFLISVFIGPALDRYDWVWNRQPVIHTPTVVDSPRADSFDWLMRLHSWIKPRIEGQSRVRFWWEDEDSRTQMFDSAAMMYLDRRVVLAEAFAAPTNELLRDRLGQRAILVYLTRRPEKITDRLAVLTTRGFSVSNERATTLPFHGENIRVAMYDLVATPERR